DAPTVEPAPANHASTARGSDPAVPIFRKDGELRMHGNDERISLNNLIAGTGLLEKIVLKVATASR
ncbi:MAG: hypothetical protein ABUS51_10845, partial [Acidobacteriota bacterium]